VHEPPPFVSILIEIAGPRTGGERRPVIATSAIFIVSFPTIARQDKLGSYRILSPGPGQLGDTPRRLGTLKGTVLYIAPDF
jgi:hypothetical protein